MLWTSQASCSWQHSDRYDTPCQIQSTPLLHTNTDSEQRSSVFSINLYCCQVATLRHASVSLCTIMISVENTENLAENDLAIIAKHSDHFTTLSSLKSVNFFICCDIYRHFYHNFDIYLPSKSAVSKVVCCSIF